MKNKLLLVYYVTPVLFICAWEWFWSHLIHLLKMICYLVGTICFLIIAIFFTWFCILGYTVQSIRDFFYLRKLYKEI